MTEITAITPLQHRSANGTNFRCRADLISGVITEDVPEDKNLAMADAGEFLGWHAVNIYPQLNGFRGYDCVEFVNHNRSGLAVKEDDCPVTTSLRAAFYATGLSPTEDDVIGIVTALREDFPQMGIESYDEYFKTIAAKIADYVESWDAGGAVGTKNVADYIRERYLDD